MKSRSALELFGLSPAIWLFVSFLFLAAGLVRAAPSFNADHALAWSPNIGWLNWRPDPTSGVQVGEYICSGFIYAANVGWINLGSGAPTNGIQYSNASAADFGVNHDRQGNLSGLAYGANIGWINFETNGAPRLDLVTGRLSGFIYSANVGWISLGDSSFFLQVDSIAPGTDIDQDGIPDAWELAHAGNLTTLSAGADADSDGQLDVEEYRADTDPLSPTDQLRIVAFQMPLNQKTALLTWIAQPTRHYFIESRKDFGIDNTWTDSGLGFQVTAPQTLSATVTNRPDSAHNFYRIRAVVPLAR